MGYHRFLGCLFCGVQDHVLKQIIHGFAMVDKMLVNLNARIAAVVIQTSIFLRNNALAAYNKALAIDSQYGKAMFGKAIILRNLGKLEQAMALSNEILELYNDADVQRFKTELIKSGVRDTTGIYSLQQAIDKMTSKAYEISAANRLLDKDGRIHTIREITQKEDFSGRIYSFCKRRYSSLGKEKVWSESIIGAFYGSAYVALQYYQTPEVFHNVNYYDYLQNNVNLEELDRSTEKLLGILGDDNLSGKVWSIIYSFATFCVPIIGGVEPASDLDTAAKDATESAYMLGMLLAMRHHEQEELKASRSALNNALQKLADSSKDYDYSPPQRSAMCYSMRAPKIVPLYFRCDGCGQNTNIEVHESNGKEKEIIKNYQSVASKFSERGYPSAFKCYCDQCANKYYPSANPYTVHNFVFSLTRPDCKKPVISYPSTDSFNNFKYRIALAFISGADTLSKLSAATNTTLTASEYLEHVHTVLGNVVTDMGGDSK